MYCARRFVPLGLALAVLVVGGGSLFAGCLGGETSARLDPGDLAGRFLPSTRQVEYHPDSLRALQIQEKDNRLHFKLETGYSTLHRLWSSSYQNLGVGETVQRPLSYATFWSRELVLASLDAEMGVSSLQKERARTLIDKRENEYRDALRFDVYWFEPEGNSLLAAAGTRVELRVGGERYRPARQSHTPLREAFIVGRSGPVLYRRNTFHFPRTVDDADILDEATRVTLTINRTGGGNRVRFAWEWKLGE
jgi:hypothetical protein